MASNCTAAPDVSRTDASPATAADSSAPDAATLHVPIRQNSLQQFFEGGARLTKAAHWVYGSVVQAGDTVVDATCGRGWDSLLLCQMIGPYGTLIAMDIQESALESTKKLLNDRLDSEHMPNVQLVHMCHSRLREVLTEEVHPSLVCFNLGYLPHAPDKAVKTEASTTAVALHTALQAITKGGAVVAAAYVGHEGGREELEICQQIFRDLDTQDWVSSEIQVVNRVDSPHLLSAYKLQRSSGR
eukprot:CAMPEP_0206148094 /NCGR_PEP_ID=MMETSP1473-20131121/35532_1 /ASSEMBLY_ACC=CAM_ASM_001109 /TAXON_ID=1461547 /ORGANISM="Stichococcus sp, Strain RCC1054" /LENGTH=242 /DNA_ID=CAMNT_0053545291 /DNA_START=90 /DNA_END=818 /DNA_ORIENTATION=+